LTVPFFNFLALVQQIVSISVRLDSATWPILMSHCFYWLNTKMHFLKMRYERVALPTVYNIPLQKNKIIINCTSCTIDLSSWWRFHCDVCLMCETNCIGIFTAITECHRIDIQVRALPYSSFDFSPIDLYNSLWRELHTISNKQITHAKTHDRLNALRQHLFRNSLIWKNLITSHDLLVFFIIKKMLALVICLLFPTTFIKKWINIKYMNKTQIITEFLN